MLHHNFHNPDFETVDEMIRLSPQQQRIETVTPASLPARTGASMWR